MGLLDFIKSAGAPTEEDSERDGFLSYSGETHTLVEGVYSGFTTSPWHHPQVPEEYQDKESWYWKGGYVVGSLTQGAFLILGSYGVFESGILG